MTHKQNPRILLMMLLLWMPVQQAGPAASQSTVQILGDFQPGWAEDWMEEELGDAATIYRVTEDNGELALLAESNNSASALYRRLAIPVADGTISWRWKVAQSLAGNREERTKRGDDYAARVLLIFGPELFSRKTRALCYVWAGSEAVGSVYPSPYTENIGTFVLQSGDRHAGTWVQETRDFAQDYRQFFGEQAAHIGAIALIVDSDNTGSQAIAWFDDIVVTFGEN